MPTQFARDLPDLCGQFIGGGRYHLTSLIGKGGFGKVYQGSDTHDPSREVAIKCISKDFPNWKDECDLHQKAASATDSVLPIYEAWEEEHYIFVVLELYWALWFFLPIVTGVLDCHQRGFHPIYISDFGLATEQPLSNEFHYGTCWIHCAGDVPGSTLYSSALNDVWSLGVILFYLLTGNAPWVSADPSNFHYKEYLADPRKFLIAVGVPAGPLLELLLRVFDDMVDSLQDIVDARQADLQAEMESKRSHVFPIGSLTSQWTAALITPAPGYDAFGTVHLVRPTAADHPDRLAPFRDLPSFGAAALCRDPDRILPRPWLHPHLPLQGANRPPAVDPVNNTSPSTWIPLPSLRDLGIAHLARGEQTDM
ncbi:kinase-like domain-containing protein [Flagelloscypha sp. PMI_526]|nr:kinase-like domain-containing protein [Flagelloscypha sp. PMI_526]